MLGCCTVYVFQSGWSGNLDSKNVTDLTEQTAREQEQSNREQTVRSKSDEKAVMLPVHKTVALFRISIADIITSIFVKHC